MTFLKLQREVGGKKGTLLVLPTSRALRGEGEDVRGLLMAREGWKRTSSGYHQPSAERCCMSLCGSTKNCSGPVQQNPAGPVAPMGWTSTQPGWGCGGKSWRRRAGEGLKVVAFSFLQLSFMAHKPARGLPAPIPITPYIMGDTRASLRAGNGHQAGNRQGRDIYATVPKPMSSFRVSRP